MRQRDLIKKLEHAGWWYLREGGNHSIYTDGVHRQPVPRHPNINDQTAKDIIKRWGL